MVKHGGNQYQIRLPEAILSMAATSETAEVNFLALLASGVGSQIILKISNNEISNLPYTGISIGWMWNPTPTPAGKKSH